MAALFAALSGASRSSILAPAFVRAHARPDPCMASGPCTDRARARTNKALQPRPAMQRKTFKHIPCAHSPPAHAEPRHTRPLAHDRPPHTRTARPGPHQQPTVSRRLPSALSNCCRLIFLIFSASNTKATKARTGATEATQKLQKPESCAKAAESYCHHGSRHN
eukprot:6684277-Prymnesium_polylepis.2